MIRVNDLHKYYNKGKKSEQHVLDGVNLELDATGLVCILGESGSGKTTLLNTIGGIDTFSSGTISVDGEIWDKYDPAKIEPVRNERFDFVFQNYYLLKDYTVEYNIKLALNRYDLTEEEKDVRTDYVLNMLGIAKYRKKLVSALSGGQKQRVSIARALVKSPDVILADEPTGNLDEENTIRTMTILRNISKECLVLLVTHERRIANFFADRIIEIQDGRIIRDEKNKSCSSYERSDDSNIYLRELEKTSMEGDRAVFTVYEEKGENERKIDLTFAWKDNKLYIRNNMGCDILMEGVETGVEMLDMERPVLDMEDVEQFAYDLPKMKSRGKAKLAFHEICRMALENIRLMGKKQIFIAGVMIATAILLTVTMIEFLNTEAVNEAAVVGTDTHYVSVEFVKNSRDAWRTSDFINEYMQNDIHGEPFFVPELKVYMTGSGYAQLGNLTQMLKNYSYTSLDHLEESDLICGEMPQKRDEVVIDRQLIENTEAQNGPVTSLHDSMESYVGMKLRVGGVDTELFVSGISDTGQTVIYSGQNVLFGMNAKGYEIANVQELQSEDPEKYANVSLKDDEILVRKGLYDSLSEYSQNREVSFGDNGEYVYQIVGTFEDAIGVDYVMSDAGCRVIRNQMIYESGGCMIYTLDKDDTMDYYTKAAAGDIHTGEGNFRTSFELVVSVPYLDQIESYKAEHSQNRETIIMITVVIMIISLVMVYFTVKSNAASRSEELTVYRLLGISKGSILKAYVLEMIWMTTYTSLPSVLLTGGVIRFIGSIPSLQIDLIFPFWSMFVLLAGIYAVHALISILPVLGVLSKPPAAMAVKE